MSNKLTKAGIELIKKFEGCELKAYKCSAGRWTIGYGHTSDEHLPVVEGLTITQEVADELLLLDLKEAERLVTRYLEIMIDDNKFSALVSFTFNLGGGNLRRSTLLRMVNKGSFKAAGDQFLRWVRSGGVVSKGLQRRREAERELFLKEPNYWDE